MKQTYFAWSLASFFLGLGLLCVDSFYLAVNTGDTLYSSTTIPRFFLEIPLAVHVITIIFFISASLLWHQYRHE